jgi:hypothetical protein
MKIGGPSVYPELPAGAVKPQGGWDVTLITLIGLFGGTLLGCIWAFVHVRPDLRAAQPPAGRRIGDGNSGSWDVASP